MVVNLTTSAINKTQAAEAYLWERSLIRSFGVGGFTINRPHILVAAYIKGNEKGRFAPACPHPPWQAHLLCLLRSIFASVRTYISRVPMQIKDPMKNPASWTNNYEFLAFPLGPKKAIVGLAGLQLVNTLINLCVCMCVCARACVHAHVCTCTSAGTRACEHAVRIFLYVCILSALLH